MKKIKENKGVVKMLYKVEIRKTKNNRRLGKQEAITLIALVITIILLLILSGVVINLSIRSKWAFS